MSDKIVPVPVDSTNGVPAFGHPQFNGVSAVGRYSPQHGIPYLTFTERDNMEAIDDAPAKAGRRSK